jgi:hypothetical protein
MGEAKNFNREIGLKEVREFLGMYIDIIQHPRIHTKSRISTRNEEILQSRFTYCPVYFSMKGFHRSAQHFMFAHGITFFSYENSEIMLQLDKKIAKLLAQVRFHKMISNDFKNFKELSLMKNIRPDLKKDDFDDANEKLDSYLNSVLSYVGVLDKRFPIHILTQKKTIPKKPGEIKLELLRRNSFIMKTLSNWQIGQFSLPATFVSDYIRMANKHKTIDDIFQQIDVIVPTKDNLLISNLRINKQSRSDVIDFFTKPLPDITQIYAQLHQDLSSE